MSLDFANLALVRYADARPRIRDADLLLFRRLAGCDYGYRAVLAAALVHLPIARLLVRADVNDARLDRGPPFCSQACTMADRTGGGVDPVPHLADRLTEPADLARSALYQYRFTLLP